MVSSYPTNEGKVVNIGFSAPQLNIVSIFTSVKNSTRIFKCFQVVVVAFRYDQYSLFFTSHLKVLHKEDTGFSGVWESGDQNQEGSS